MKKLRGRAKAREPVETDEILPEYDFSKAGRNPYASKYATGSSVVVLEPDVAAAFPTSGEANEALRALAEIIWKHPAAGQCLVAVPKRRRKRNGERSDTARHWGFYRE